MLGDIYLDSDFIKWSAAGSTRNSSLAGQATEYEDHRDFGAS